MTFVLANLFEITTSFHLFPLPRSIFSLYFSFFVLFFSAYLLLTCFIKFYLFFVIVGTSLVVQWLRLHTSTQGQWFDPYLGNYDPE